MKVIAHREPWSSRVGLMMLSDDGVAVAANITFEAFNSGDYISPAAYLDQNDAQGLMDSLWSAGLRPSEGSGSAGALAATQRHLDDMRTLVFKDVNP
jgi:hypothetical protein